MANKRQMIEFYYDCISPYSYFAFEVIQRYANVWNVDIIYKPILVGGVFKATGNSAPGSIPAKGKTLAQDIPRLSRYFKVPVVEWNFGEMIANGSLPTMRFVTAVRLYKPDYLIEVSRQFFARRFYEDKDFTSLEALKEVSIKAGLSYFDVDNLIKKMNTPEVKNALKDITSEATEKGAFGVPTFVANINGQEEVFFGSDRFPIIAQEIGEKWVGPDPIKAKL